MDIKQMFENDLAMIEAVMDKMRSNEKKMNIEDNIIMCDLIIDTFTNVKNIYLEKLNNQPEN